MGWDPSRWAGLVPTGLFTQKPRHFTGMARVLWENRDQVPFAWRTLTKGVCDGCALGTTGLHDFTIDGVHLCMVRLELLRTNTAPALDPARLGDVSSLARLSSKALRALGRLPYPMRRRRGEKGFTRISWDDAIASAGARLASAPPSSVSFYVTSRGITNETYYVAGKVARFLGTNNVDNSARLCHSPSTVAMKGAIGWGASTCSYSDWLGTDLVVFFGANTPNNQPVTTKYLHKAKKLGTRVAVVNPLKEPGLERYWVPSETESALFGTRIADEWFSVHTGGDLAFLIGVGKHLVAIGGVDDAFVRDRTAGFAAWKASLDAQSFDDLTRLSGATSDEMLRFARLLAGARTGVLVWSMGLTQHRHGSDTVRAVLNLGLARGWVGREKCGLMPIRGHSGVQGGAEVGCVPNALPGGGLDEASRARLEGAWGFPIPAAKGWNATEALEAAGRGDVDVLWSIGGNFLETVPDPESIADALARVPFRVHQDVVVTSQMLVPPADEVLLLPATTRYEMPGGGTETSTERRILFSPEIPGRRIGEARPEWEVLLDAAAKARPERAAALRNADMRDTAGIRREIARTQPLYAGIETLSKAGDAVQWGGPRLGADGRFATPDGKAHFSPVAPPERTLKEGELFVSTRRGKQFNSMVHDDTDPLTGARREDVLLSVEDAHRLGVADGDAVRLRRGAVTFDGHARISPIRPGNLQVHWPEGNALCDSGCDPEAGVPDYNAVVTLEKTGGAEG
jgi:molybdopterin-dependent oxidoreductase alpha subunit